MQYDLRKGGIIMAVKTSDNIKRYQNPGGPEIGTVSRRIIERDGLVFKDIDGSGQVTAVNDWRLPPEERAAAYVKVLSVKEKIAQLVWLCAQNQFHFDYVDTGCFLTLGTVQRKFDQDCIFANLGVRPASAFWTGYPLRIIFPVSHWNSSFGGYGSASKRLARK